MIITRMSKLLVIGLCAFAAVKCGNPNATDGPPSQLAGEESLKAVTGRAGFGTQCAGGFQTDPFSVGLELWECPIEADRLVLAEDIQPLIVSADCKEKTLTVRSADRTINTVWNIMPDGSFHVAVDKMTAKIESAGRDAQDCTTPIVATLMGKLKCNSRDQVDIDMDVVYWLDKEVSDIQPSPSASPTPTPTPSPGVSPRPSPAPSVIPSPRPSVNPRIMVNGVRTVETAPGTFVVDLNASFARTSATPPNSAPGTAAPRCTLPKGCYMFSQVTIQQCR